MEMSTGSTAFSPTTRARMIRPLVLLRTGTTSPRLPASCASPATWTSTPELRAMMLTVAPRFTRTGSISHRELTTCPLRSARRLDLPTACCRSDRASPAVASRRSSATWLASIGRPAMTSVAATTTSAVSAARTTNSARQDGAALHMVAKRIRVRCRVSSASTTTSSAQAFAASRAITLSSTDGLRRPALRACSSTCSRAACSTRVSIDAGAAATALLTHSAISRM